MQDNQIKNIVEAALMAAARPLSLDELAGVFGIEAPERGELVAALEALKADYEGRGIMLTEVASGYRVQIRTTMTEWVSRLWEERPPRYSRALLETLALIAYRQPITRGEIEEIRGVSVSSNIVRTLSERGWVRVVGHRDVPGRPAMYATTREFLDYFGLKRLDELPPLSELRDLDSLNVELDLGDRAEAGGGTDRAGAGSAPAAERAGEAGPEVVGPAEGDAGVSAEAGAGDEAPARSAEAPEGIETADDDADVTAEGASEGDGSGEPETPRSATVVPLKKPGSA